MSYQNCVYEREKNIIHLWDDKTGYESFPYQRYGYKIDTCGDYITLDNKTVSKVFDWNESDEENGLIYESDLAPEMRVLIDRYYETDDVSENHRELFFDIEVKSEDGFPLPETADQEITAIAYYYKPLKYYCVFIVDSKGKIQHKKQNNIEIIPCKSERELILEFISHFRKLDPTIISGWNCINEDEHIWLDNKITVLKNKIISKQLDKYGKIIQQINTGLKQGYELKLISGQTIITSNNHIFPIHRKLKTQYRNTNTLMPTMDFNVTDIMNSMNDYDQYFRIEKHDNKNSDLTYKQYIINNLEILLQYDHFDFLISSETIRNYLKQNFPTETLNIIKSKSHWQGKLFFRHNLNWRYSNFKNIISIDMIKEFILNTDSMYFLFNKKVSIVDINDIIDNSTLKLLGFIFTDGWINRKTLSCNISNTDTGNIIDYTHILNKYTHHKNKKNHFVLHKDKCSYTTFINPFFRLLYSCIYDNKHNKKINVELLSNLSYNQFLSFFSGMIDGDGSVRKYYVSLCNFEDNLKNIHELLLWNGVFSIINKSNTSLYIGCNQFTNGFIKSLNISHSIRKYNLDNITTNTKLQCASNNIKYFEYDDCIYVKLSSITPVQHVNMYDLSTESHYFICNGIKTHNCDWFDIPYFYNRAKKIVGERQANKLSPIGIVKWSKLNNTYKIYGVSSLDYMRLYKNYTQNEQPSYSLDFISILELCHGKIKYNGSLDSLYLNDPEKFIKYNLNDVQLIVKLDQKRDFITLARGIAHKGHIPYEEVYMSSRYIDGASLVYMKRNNIIAPNRKKREKITLQRNHKISETEIEMIDVIPEHIPRSGTLRFKKSKSVYYDFEYIDFTDNTFILKDPIDRPILKDWEVGFHFDGAFVKEPKPGKYFWLYDLDLASMYPSNIMTLNISPETKVGKILRFDKKIFISQDDYSFNVYVGEEIKSLTSKQIKDIVIKNKFSIASNGVMYRTDVVGLIPSILDLWFGQRTEFKDLMKKYGKDGNEVLYKFYNSRQNVMKVMLNSFYGVLGLSSFRFYDLDNADAVTSTGRSLIQFSSDMANYFYNTELDSNDVDYIDYTDTDSVFLSALPIVKHRYPEVDINDTELMTKYILEIAKEVQDFINEAYTPYAKKFHFVDKHRWKIKQELIATSGLWIAKKRYALLVINKEGVPLTEHNTSKELQVFDADGNFMGEIDVKGIDVVRSNFPKEFRTFTRGILGDILMNVEQNVINKKIFELRDRLKDLSALDIMFPTGVNNVDLYCNEELFHYKKGTPAHVKAALSYNDLLQLFEYNTIEPIKEGEKVKWTYLRENKYNLDSIALKGDDTDPQQIVELVELYMDRQKNFESVLKSKLEDFYKAIGWGKIPDSDLIDNFFE